VKGQLRLGYGSRTHAKSVRSQTAVHRLTHGAVVPVRTIQSSAEQCYAPVSPVSGSKLHRPLLSAKVDLCPRPLSHVSSGATPRGMISLAWKKSQQQTRICKVTLSRFPNCVCICVCRSSLIGSCDACRRHVLRRSAPRRFQRRANGFIRSFIR